MNKRVRSLSIDQTRSLNSLQEELSLYVLNNRIIGVISRLKNEVETPDAASSSVRGDAVVYKMMRQTDPIFGAADHTAQSVAVSSRLIAQAARRQLVADTLRSCIVNEHNSSSGLDESLVEFLSDLDGKSIGLVSTGWQKKACIVSTRREEINSEPTKLDVDLSLDSYIDAFSADDMYSMIPVKDDGSFDTSSMSRVIKTIPWFDEFTETVTLNQVASLGKVRGKVHRDFSHLKQFYTKAIIKCSQIYNHHWLHVSADRLALLNQNFPRGILGFRALLHPEDPRNLRSLLIKPGDLSHILTSNKRTSEAEEKEIEKEVLSELGPRASKYATLPDLASAWSDLPRVRWINSNRVVSNMCEMENAAIDEMPPWTLGEIRTFLERIAMHGKNFKRISSVLSDKTERDCVDLYYRFKIHLSMKQIIAAGLQSRQDRRSSSNQTGGVNLVHYRSLIEEVMIQLEDILGSQWLTWHKQLERLTIRKIAETAGLPVKIYGQTAEGDESPKRERRNAMIDILTNVIGRGHPVPPQLTLMVDTSALSTPVTSPPLTASIPRAPRLSMVKTEIALLLPSRPESTELPQAARQLQAHNTI